MKSSWVRPVKIKKAPPASGLRLYKLVARDIHVDHRVRHHTPLRDVQPLDPWTLGPLKSWTQGDRPFPFLRRSDERDPLQRAMCVALMRHSHCGFASPQALLQLTASPRSASSRFAASLQHTSTEHTTSSSMGFLTLRRCGRGGLRLRRTQSDGRGNTISTGQAHRPPPGAGRQEIGEQL